MKRAPNKRPYPETPAVLERRRRTAEAIRGRANPNCARPLERHPNWKGDEVGYVGVHHWLARHVGRAAEHLCLSCLGPAAEWANLSGEYRRDAEDFAPLCVSCHKWFDSVIHMSLPDEKEAC